MERVDASHLSTVILTAPGWVRVGITSRDPRLRERAADCLAATIMAKVIEPVVEVDPRQMTLTLAPPIG